MNNKTVILTRRRIFILAAAAVLLLMFALFAVDSRLIVQPYVIDADEINTPIRIALITDLHSCDYGENQSELIMALDAQKPDLILLVGDIFDHELDDANTAEFLAGIAGRYPSYYVTGNHECWSGIERFASQMAILEACGIPILFGEGSMVEINGEQIYLYGVDDPDIYAILYDKEIDEVRHDQAKEEKEAAFLAALSAVSAEAAETDAYTILLSHRPEYYETYLGYDFDLVVCGHAHGGQWRIPYLINGLYAPHQGLFPKYAGGRYDSDRMTMIVSRGLARETTWVPRIFNRPELVIIDLK